LLTRFNDENVILQASSVISLLIVITVSFWSHLDQSFVYSLFYFKPLPIINAVGAAIVFAIFD
jgi:hypothetical protein